MQTSRIMTTRGNQQLEKIEASTREVEVLNDIAHERDKYYGELLQSIARSTTPAVNPAPKKCYPTNTICTSSIRWYTSTTSP
eukprot:717150-Amphidinium_carterae.1